MPLAQVQLIRRDRQLELYRRCGQPPGGHAVVLGTAAAARRELHRHGARILGLNLAVTLRTQPRRGRPYRLPATGNDCPRRVLRRDHLALDDLRIRLRPRPGGWRKALGQPSEVRRHPGNRHLNGPGYLLAAASRLLQGLSLSRGTGNDMLRRPVR
jgi:hypothetical protein